ncbi:hypothetical protein L6164_023987 [Bauhinia variegata]|uniref:Uncharacterized protein n=1 Tax=Bauhinia variegata TaxID=167791 RepID=A0ACB9LXP7_BAUVA|nr:hypothetical protein L6164_023987 [Bauhinia variegata]
MENIDYSSHGLIGKDKLVCQAVYKVSSEGLWNLHNPLKISTSLLIFQIIVIFIVSRITYFLLRPFHQTMLTSQIVAGIIMGPSCLGKDKAYFEILFPMGSRLVISTFAEFGILFYFFKAGVQVNPSYILNIGREPIVIGIVGNWVSAIFSGVTFIIVKSVANIPKEIEPSILLIVVNGAFTSFVVLSDFLRELKILNSEIGRLALSSALISDAVSWLVIFLIFRVGMLSYRPIAETVMIVSYFSVVFFLFRPMVIWISKRNPDGKPMTQTHFLAIICMLFFVSFSAQYVGIKGFFGAYMFGLILPDGPPLGSVLSDKFDSIFSALLVPVYCAISGFNTDTSELADPLTTNIECIILSGYIGKFVGTILSSLYLQFQTRDSFALALIMCCKGISELCLNSALYATKDSTMKIFTLLVINLVVITGLLTPIVHYIYDPSRKYKSYIRKTIIDSDKDLDFRILACIYGEENVYPMINLLQLSHPPNTKPLSVFVIQLMELTGRAASILKKNTTKVKSFSKMTPIQHIANVFDQFELQHKEGFTVQNFTANAPFATMHEDICTMAMDKRTNIVILPFHKQWTVDGQAEVSHPLIRTVNQNVLKRVPCSVGILIDRSHMAGKVLIISENSCYRIAMIFLGGNDDREALAYAMHMVGHSHVTLTIVCISSERDRKHINKKNNCSLSEYVKACAMSRGDVSFNEEIVQDGAGTTEVIRKMESNVDMVIVGRHQDTSFSSILGLTEWSEHPELGPVGDLLASSDFRFSVLVVQEKFSRYDSWI